MYTTRPKPDLGCPMRFCHIGWVLQPMFGVTPPSFLPCWLVLGEPLPCRMPVLGCPSPASSLFLDISSFPPGSLFFFVCCRSPPTLLSSEINIFAPRSLLFVYLFT